jgi:integrase
VFKVACELDLATQNPALKISKVKITSKELTLPSRKQFHDIVEAIRSTGAPCAHDAADLVKFIAYSGCRITEASFVRWSDVDAKSGMIRIHGHEETGTKTGQVLSVPITPPMRDLLDRVANRCRRFVVSESFCPRFLTGVLQGFWASYQRLSNRIRQAQNSDRAGKGFISA